MRLDQTVYQEYLLYTMTALYNREKTLYKVRKVTTGGLSRDPAGRPMYVTSSC